jgi:hypothetical protein
MTLSAQFLFLPPKATQAAKAAQGPASPGTECRNLFSSIISAKWLFLEEFQPFPPTIYSFKLA